MRAVPIKRAVLEALGNLQAAYDRSSSEHEQVLDLRDAAIEGVARLRGALPVRDDERAIAVDARYALLRLQLAIEKACLEGQVLDEPASEALMRDVVAAEGRARSLPDRSDPMDTIRPRHR